MQVLRYVAGVVVLSGSINPVQAADWSERLVNQIKRHPLVLQSEQRYEAALATQNAASQPLYNPELSASYDDKPDAAYAVSVSQQWDRSGLRTVKEQIGEIGARMAALEVQRVGNDIAADTLRGLIEKRRADTLLRLAAEQYDITRNIVGLTEKRVAAGDIGELDLQLMRLAQTESLQALTNAENNQQRTHSQLKMLLGDTVIELPDGVSVIQEFEPDLDAFVDQLPVVLMSELRSQQAGLQVREARRSSKANPTFGVGLGKDGNDNVLSFSVSVPLNIRNRYTAEIEAAEAERLAIDQSVRYTRVRAFTDLQRDWQTFLRYQNTPDKLQQPRQRDLSQVNAQLKKLWRLGDMTTTSYLQNLQQRNTALIAEVEIDTEAALSMVEWLRSSNQMLSWLKQQ